jgi:putative phage-type endonuclease
MITDRQLAARKEYLGASEIAALYGLDPFQTAYDVYASKVYELERPMPETDAQSRGNRYEAALIDFASHTLGVQIDTDPERMEYRHPDYRFLVAHLDGLTDPVDGERCIVECKTTVVTDEWGDQWTDMVPNRVNIQCQFQMELSEKKKAYVAALLGRRGAFEGIYVIEYNEEIAKAIVARAVDFWHNNVLTKTPPPDSLPGNIEYLERIRRSPKTWASIGDDPVLAWHEASQKRIEAEKVEKDAKARLLVAIGDNEGVRLSDGRVFSYLLQERAKDITKKVKELYPAIYETLADKSQYRVPRITKG